MHIPIEGFNPSSGRWPLQAYSRHRGYLGQDGVSIPQAGGGLFRLFKLEHRTVLEGPVSIPQAGGGLFRLLEGLSVHLV